MWILKALTPVGALVSLAHFHADRLRLKKLIRRGLKVGRNVYIQADVEFDLGYPYLIEIQDNCRISRGVRILTHDATTFRDLGVTRLAPVRILEGSFIGERVVILPGVTIGPRTLVAAGSVVNRDMGPDTTVAGNPARPYGHFSELLQKHRMAASTTRVFKKWEIEQGTVTHSDIVAALAKDGVAFVHGVPKSDPHYVNTDMDEIRRAAVEAYRAAVEAHRGPAE